MDVIVVSSFLDEDGVRSLMRTCHKYRKILSDYLSNLSIKMCKEYGDRFSLVKVVNPKLIVLISPLNRDTVVSFSSEYKFMIIALDDEEYNIYTNSVVECGTETRGIVLWNSGTCGLRSL